MTPTDPRPDEPRPDEPRPDEPRPDERPGPLAWVAIAAGWAVMVVAVVGAAGDPRLDGAGSWGAWLIGSAVVHDAVVLPLVLAVGWVLWRACPTDWLVPVRTALVLGGTLTLATWPIARRWGARSDNPSILPLPVARNLAIMWGVLAVLAVTAGAVAHVRHRRSGSEAEWS